MRIWISASYHGAFGCGGWAQVREAAGELSGAAGGERATTAHRMALTSLLAALGALPKAPPETLAKTLALGSQPPLTVLTTSPELAARADGLASASPEAGEGPDEDRDLWARILATASGRRLEVRFAPARPQTPAAFTAAWAETARDKAKMTGAFTAAIPRPNLARIPGLAASSSAVASQRSR